MSSNPNGIPNEIWEYILEFVPNWSTLHATSKINSHLWHYVRGPWFPTRILLGFTKYATEKQALESAKSWLCKVAILDRKCQLCKKNYHTGYVQPVWAIYAHSHCVRKEVIPITQAATTYDLPYEKLAELPRQNNAVWKYHGGRACLSFSVMFTIQGLCLTLCHESLYDRRVRIEKLRNDVHESYEIEKKLLETKKRKYKEIADQDNVIMQTERLARIGNARHVRELHLAPLLTKYRILPELALMFQNAIYNSVSMRFSWKQLEIIIRDWSFHQHRVDIKSLTTKDLLRTSINSQ